MSAAGRWMLQTAGIAALLLCAGATAQESPETEVLVAAIVQKAAQTPAPAGADLRLVGDFYAAFMDQDGIEERGLRPLEGLRERIDAISDRHELSRFFGETLRVNGPDPLFRLAVATDRGSPARYALYLLPGEAGLQDRADRGGVLVTLMKLAGVTDPVMRAQRVLALEVRIAGAQVTPDEPRDQPASHWRRSELRSLAPGLDWKALLEATGMPNGQRELLVPQPGAIRAIAALADSEPLPAWKDYLWVHAIMQRAAELPKAFGDALPGHQEARWKRALAATNSALGDAVGRLYVAKHFPPERKAALEGIARDVRDALAAQRGADGRLAGLQLGIGYPDQWRDYAGLQITRTDACGNAARAALFEHRHQLAKLGQKVDRLEWIATPQGTEAVRLPLRDAWNFPAGMFPVPPSDGAQSLAFDYEAAGSLIARTLAQAYPGGDPAAGGAIERERIPRP